MLSRRMSSMKYFIFSLIWVVNERAKDNSFPLNQNKSSSELNGRILRLDTPEPWGDSETYEIRTRDRSGNLITTVFNRYGEALYYYTDKKERRKKKSSKGINS
ncbi:hypothetical protein MKS88_001032 [Plasmodium brasilianum]|uniref:Uncharacterized protein n=1 Tax=Plasmodium brasilianum TaxID=5824 RepID=A0ACB9YF87_PLABR|nr:hypothetical protein MKS88_001032 [Plasmodium brasilianum]